MKTARTLMLCAIVFFTQEAFSQNQHKLYVTKAGIALHAGDSITMGQPTLVKSFVSFKYSAMRWLGVSIDENNLPKEYANTRFEIRRFFASKSDTAMHLVMKRAGVTRYEISIEKAIANGELIVR